MNMLPADEPTRNNPVTLPDSPINRSASPNTFGKTGATASPNPIAPNHNMKDDGPKISSESVISSEIDRLVAISGTALNRALIQIVARRPTVNAAQNPEFRRAAL